MKAVIFVLAVLLIIPVGTAQTDDLGDVIWTMDLQSITGTSLHLGVEFDSTNFWSTAPDGIDPKLYEFTPGGTLVNTYNQPSGNWGAWGWRDLAWDGQYLYAGSDTDQANQIVQIDPADGQKTGTAYGPFPVNPCRALAYETKRDCFWTASFTSSIYQCFRDGTYNTYTNPGFVIYGAAMEESDPDFPKLWWLTQDGNGAYAVEFDPLTGTFTGNLFEVSPFFYGGITSAACAYNAGWGEWHLVIVEQGCMLTAYDLGLPGKPLTTDRYKVSGWFGGEVVFYLDAGKENANRYYGILGSITGTSPGTMLPGGMILPINWDYFTEALLLLVLSGSPYVPFTGNLDGGGSAEIVMTVPPRTMPLGASTYFAFCLANPFDFVSNPTMVIIMGKP
ncbi:MAG: hypothetical protein ACYTG7_08480 [Planctomycetota bacterium]|jgi:hypothetical protein